MERQVYFIYWRDTWLGPALASSPGEAIQKILRDRPDLWKFGPSLTAVLVLEGMNRIESEETSRPPVRKKRTNRIHSKTRAQPAVVFVDDGESWTLQDIMDREG